MYSKVKVRVDLSNTDACALEQVSYFVYIITYKFWRVRYCRKVTFKVRVQGTAVQCT